MARIGREGRRYEDVRSFIGELYGPDLHAKRVGSLAGATLGTMTAASLAVALIGQALAQARGLKTKHAIKQVDRLLSNDGIDVWDSFARWVPHQIGERRDILVAMDWTDFDDDDQATLVLSLVTGHGRAAPLLWLTVWKEELKNQRNDYEDACLRRLSELVPPGCTVHTLARPGEDAAGALEALAEVLGAPGDGGAPAPSGRPERPAGAITAETLAAAVGATLPEGAIVVDEGNTSGLFVPAATAGAPRHDWLTLTGGAIGIGLPMATGAAVAAPERPVLCLQADGSAMYTLQALWTQAREGLNVTTLVLSNRSYAILNMELHRVGADAGGPLARRLLDLTDPDLDFCDLARGMGVPARRVENAEDLTTGLATGFAEAGPTLIEVLL